MKRFGILALAFTFLTGAAVTSFAQDTTTTGRDQEEEKEEEVRRRHQEVVEPFRAGLLGPPNLAPLFRIDSPQPFRFLP